MDRASILGDTIEYLKQLRRRIQELETGARLLRMDGHYLTAPVVPEEKRAHRSSSSSAAMAETGSNKVRAVEASGGGAGRPAASTELQVSMIGSEAVEVRCPPRDGLLLRVMQALHGRELGLEVTSVQASSSAGDVLLVELRAKVNCSKYSLPDSLALPSAGQTQSLSRQRGLCRVSDFGYLARSLPRALALGIGATWCDPGRALCRVPNGSHSTKY